MDKLIAHLGFIQGIITRMGSNSFFLKGWSVTLVAALFALAAKDTDKGFMLISYFPVFVFWMLDGYFLHQQKLFRMLYEEVASGNINSDEFTLDTSVVQNLVPSLLSVILSKTLFYFHGTIVVVILFAMFVLVR
jgi:hypothetical protein